MAGHLTGGQRVIGLNRNPSRTLQSEPLFGCIVSHL